MKKWLVQPTSAPNRHKPSTAASTATGVSTSPHIDAAKSTEGWTIPSCIANWLRLIAFRICMDLRVTRVLSAELALMCRTCSNSSLCSADSAAGGCESVWVGASGLAADLRRSNDEARSARITIELHHF